MSPMRFFFSEKCIHMILWIANPLCDDAACWHAALRVLRAEAAKIRTEFSRRLLFFFRWAS